MFVVNISIVAELNVVEVCLIVEEDLGIGQPACQEASYKSRAQSDTEGDCHGSQVVVCLYSCCSVGLQKEDIALLNRAKIVFSSCTANY